MFTKVLSVHCIIMYSRMNDAERAAKASKLINAQKMRRILGAQYLPTKIA